MEMERNKTRRNSILKKSNDEDTTGDVTAKIKRRISFSGKKSIKEFIAGEEEATIWGTSYEESADGHQASSAESGLVNVHEKRLVLRNRRVVFESNPRTKRRSKKVNVAENDKENIFSQKPETPVPTEIEHTQPETTPANQPVCVVEQENISEPKNTEKSDSKEAISQSTINHPERLNVCSNTLDFINFSATTNKSISIEQSVDVTLSESELQMFKFRIPVSTAELSPNLSMRDSLSPNIFSNSILMTEEDTEMLKMLREKKKTNAQAAEISALDEIASSNKTITNHVVMEAEKAQGINEQQDKKRDTTYANQSMVIAPSKDRTIDPSNMDTTMVGNEYDQRSFTSSRMEVTTCLSRTDGKKQTTMHINPTMDASHYYKPETNRLKRKTITKAVSMDVTTPSTTDDNNSPLRKRLMAKGTSNTMDITSIPEDEEKRRTIHFESAAVEESTICPRVDEDLDISLPAPSRHTIYFDHNQIREDSLCQREKSSSNLTRDVMEESYANKDPKDRQDETKGRTIHFDETILHSPVPEDAEMSAPSRKTIYFDHNQIREDSLYQKEKSVSNLTKVVMEESYADKDSKERQEAKRRTIHLEETIVHSSVHENAEISAPSRKTIYFDHNQIHEDSVCQSKSNQNLVPNTKDNGMYKDEMERRTIHFESAAIAESVIYHQVRGEVATPTPSRNTIYFDHSQIPEDSICQRWTRPPSIKNSKVDNIGRNAAKEDGQVDFEISIDVSLPHRETVYFDHNQIREDSIYHGKANEIAADNNLSMEFSVCEPEDGKQNVDADKDKSLTTFPRVTHCEKTNTEAARTKSKQRKSIYTTADIVVESPKAIKAHDALHGNMTKERQSVYIATDMVEDSPQSRPSERNAKKESVFKDKSKQRESVYATADIIVESPKATKALDTVKRSVNSTKERQSVYIATNMVEDSPQALPTERNAKGESVITASDKSKQRKSIYTTADIVVESPKAIKAHDTVKRSVNLTKERQSVYIATDMVEDSPQSPPSERNAKKESVFKAKDKSKQRESVYATADIVVESPKATKAHDIVKRSVNLTKERQSVYVATDMVEDSPHSPPSERNAKKESVFTAKDKSKQRESVYATADIVVESPKATKAHETVKRSVNTIKERQSVYVTTDMVEDFPQTPPTERNAKRESVYTAADMIEDSPSNHAIRIPVNLKEDGKSVCAATDIVEESPIQPQQLIHKENEKPKVIVKHMNLQQGILGRTLSFKTLKCQKSSSQEVEPKPKSVLVTSSIPDQLETTGKPPNFCKLNEDLLHGKTKAFIEGRLPRPSLFDRLENNTTEETRFNSFMNKSTKKDYMTTPVKTSIKDYTMELSTGNAGNRYPAGLSFGESTKQLEMTSGCEKMDVTHDVQEKSFPKDSSGSSPKRRTIHYKENNDVDVSMAHSQRQTLYVNQKINIDATKCVTQDDSMELSMTPSTTPPTNKSRRQTIHSNDDIQEEPLTKTSNEHLVDLIATTSRSDGIGDNENPPITDVNTMDLSNIITYPSDDHSKRHTIHIRDAVDLDKTPSGIKSTNPSALNRKTLYLNQELDIEQTSHGNIAVESNRRTIHFHPDDKLEETFIPESQDDSTMNVSTTAEPETNTKTIPKPRRLTILEDQPVDIEASPEKFTARKTSFSRNLNFNEIPTAEQHQSSANCVKIFINDDSPLYFAGKQIKSPETTCEINRSLAEYLKAEAAARSCANSPLDMSVENTEKCRNLHPTEAVEEKTNTKRKTSYKSVNIFEESGMQPLEHHTFSASQNISERIAEGDLQSEKKCKNFMEVSNVWKQTDDPSEAKATNRLRQTIHFNSENAMDESFFDDIVPKTTTTHQVKRKTIFFDEPKNPINDMDISLAINKTKPLCGSKLVQSMRETLQENNFLFTQAEQLNTHLTENKKSTIFSTSTAENAIDLSTDAEFTPTKNKLSKSRIPQLIGSAKKLQSIKKSMDLIEQELPNLTGKRDETSIHEEPKIIISHKMQETLDNVSPKSPLRADEKLQESIEIPRKISTQISRQLLDSFDGIARRATTFQRNETLNPCLDEAEVANVSRKSMFKFDSEPITISDVSTFFVRKSLIQAAADPKDGNGIYSLNTTEALCNLDLNQFPDDNNLPGTSDSDDTVHNLEKYNKRYLELSCDTMRLSEISEDIDKTHLSLVNTLDEASDIVPPRPDYAEVELDKASLQASQPVESVEPPPLELPLKPIASVCRKCKRNRLSMSLNDTTIGSFMLEPLPVYSMNLSALQELSNKPKISDVAKIWRQKMRESDTFSIPDGSQTTVLEDDDSVEDFAIALDRDRLKMSQHRQRKEIRKEVSFMSKLRTGMESKKSIWLLNEILLASNILKFTHANIRTFAILISFTPKDARATDVVFDEIKLIPNSLHTRQWTAFEYALHYQLFVELPFNLRTLCPTSENLFQLLDHVDEVTKDVLKSGRDMLNIVLSSPATLIRDPSGCLYIRKIARVKTPENDVKLAEFQIEVRNMKKLSYESILMPPLYEFDEKIQLLPVGQDFLRIFLADPLKYMKV